MDLKEIRRLIREGKYEFSFHAQQERLEENLDIQEIEEAVVSQGEVLEEYPDDPRGESCLVLGFARAHPIHVVLGWTARKRNDQKVLKIGRASCTARV